jgi:hypothetical protein
MSNSASEASTLFQAANRGALLSYYDFKRLPKITDASESGTSDALLLYRGKKRRGEKHDPMRGPDRIAGKGTGGENRSCEIAPVMHFPNGPDRNAGRDDLAKIWFPE